MNLAQRRLLLSVILSTAIVLNLWHLRWGYKMVQPYSGYEDTFCTLQINVPAHIPPYFHGWNANTEKLLSTGSGGIFPEWQKWGNNMWREYEGSKSAMPWIDYLRKNSNATIYVGLWCVTREESAWIWGIFAPILITCLAAFFVLGWDKSANKQRE